LHDFFSFFFHKGIALSENTPNFASQFNDNETKFTQKIARLGDKVKGLVVQLVRIHACHAWGRGFESRPDRKKAQKEISELFAFIALHLTVTEML